jgi:hypothetical protein
MMEVEIKLGQPCRLAAAPIGLFMSGDELCLKTEYRTASGRIDAYIVSTGEAFWGRQPQTVQNQINTRVTPVTLEIRRPA